MVKEREQLAEAILNHALEIICLLTVEDFIVVKRPDGTRCTFSIHATEVNRNVRFSPSGYPELLFTLLDSMRLLEDKTQKMIAELASKIVRLLTREVPVKCADVSVLVSKDKWEDIAGPGEQYKNKQDTWTIEQPSTEKDYPIKFCIKNELEEGPHHSAGQPTSPVQQNTELSYPINLCIKKEPEKEPHYVPDQPTTPVQQHREQNYPFKFCIKKELEEEEPHYVADGTSDLPSSSEFIPGSLERKHRSTVNVHLPFMEAQTTSGFDFEIKIEPSEESSDDTEDSAETDYREEDYLPQDSNHKMITTCNSSSGKTSPSCEVCGKVFGSKSNLEKHLQIHTGQRPYPCSDCEKSFSCKNHLITHQRSHTGERPFACNQCDRKFIKQQHLVLHQVVHTGEKPYSCPVCGKGFTRQSSVVKHSSIHAEQKPFVCNECGKSYCQYASLVVHQRQHSGEKPFVCKYCEKAFACKATMLKHEKSHTE
ncbi:zinc finger protein Xfin-like isoform X2 [Rana temporaria]|uniref:zinc finger protein Xfin-like isoform X2 n=1 Tax=Rana temporaria TaxID=8407 RepID=UPI001AAD7287|nr:zinc finger protein Xfin-like isoform X2 [Rana temporaria]